MDAYPNLLSFGMVLPPFLHMSDEKLISKKQTVSQKIRQELFKEMSDMPKQNSDRTHTTSNYCISQNGHLLCKQHNKKPQGKYSVNTLAPYLVLGCNNDLIMEPDISKLEVHAVEHDLPGGGNATTYAVRLFQQIQALVHTVKSQDRYRSFNFKFLKYYYCVSYSEED